MAKDFAVVFGPDGARIIKGPHVSMMEPSETVAINPDLSAVRGVPPHLWSLSSGQIVVKGSLAPAKKRRHSLRPYLKALGLILLGMLLGQLL